MQPQTPFRPNSAHGAQIASHIYLRATLLKKCFFLRTNGALVQARAKNVALAFTRATFFLKNNKNRLWAPWGSFGVVSGCLGRPWESSGATMGRLWEALGRLWDALGRLWEAWGRLWGDFGRLWEGFGKTFRPTVRPPHRLYIQTPDQPHPRHHISSSSSK